MRHLRVRLKAAVLTVATASLVATGAGAATASVSTAAPVSIAAPVSAPGAVVLDLRGPVLDQAGVRRELRELEARFKGRIGAWALDTGTGKTVGNRTGQRFPMLSTFKAVAAAAVLHKARTSDPGLMDRVVRWTAADLKPNSPVTEKHVHDGLTVAELCEAAITRSDNTAANMLLKQIGGPAGLTRYFRSLKDPVSRLDRWETELNDWSPKEKRDTTTPAAMGRDLAALTTGSALDAKDRARLNGWLRANKTGDNRIRAGLPATWTIGDKTGTGGTYGTANDIAVVWPAEGGAPIIMSIYTNRRAADAAAEEQVIAKTAAILARGLGRLS
ncbi:beta-lactamase class A [Thermocatellispora tengchongensis]|uniref:Beta-lactamase n=1 Tax=Thermocatellispora tengchongensis TaxID=1073253 RepID=A0A840PK22_9ACTN|nr:class A beta-lactamase [Thermocatellispora tengchongensis]MBB5139309.1 beta-lactamase class A [Thermocatellispora tengchongensis]